MTQRVLKIILPPTEKNIATQIIEEENIVFWQEEYSEKNFVVSLLIEAENSEKLMDRFEKTYSLTPGFKLIVFPVEASIPRSDSKNTNGTLTSEKRKDSSLRISREELYADVVDSTKLTKNYVVMVVLSTIVASIGLQQNNVTVIIGAMVIAPFLGSNVALALSSCLADKNLGINAIKTLTSGIFIVIILSAIFGYIFDTSVTIPEIELRTQLELPDVFLALASGAAGVLAFTAGASSTIIGVMVAVALLPPLTVFGLLIGSGNYLNALGALVFFFINVVCINLAGVVMFYIQGVTPRIWWEADKAKKATRTSLLLWSFLLFFLLVMITFIDIK